MERDELKAENKIQLINNDMLKSRANRMIPVDDAINAFERHLNCHPRAILSARFGDGKSFFLSAVEEKLRGRFVFLKVYPVNYQVAENKDIFEYIKRDLLFQLYGNGMVPESYVIPNSIASYFFLNNNWEEFAKEILEELSLFDSSNTIKATLGAAKFLRSMKKRYDEFRDNGGNLGVLLDRFIDSFENKGIYEADPITSVLCDIISNWKKAHRKKKVCLVFEDLDRIDPAHIFRILNVISAQIDYGYKYGVSPKSNGLEGNKFGVDNIVVCLDYDNLEGIFEHFYGQRACFEGYINKFSDRGIFRYSLREQLARAYVDELMCVSGLNDVAIRVIVEQLDITKYSLRQLYHATEEVEGQVFLSPGLGTITPHRGLFVISATLRRLGFSSDDIVKVMLKAYREQPDTIASYLATCIMLRKGIERGAYAFSMGEKRDGFYLVYSIGAYLETGQVRLDSHLYSQWKNCINPEEEFQYILSFVGE